MKKYALQLGLVFLALAILAGTIFVAPWIFNAFHNVPFRFIISFIFLVLISNLLAKIAYIYINS